MKYKCILFGHTGVLLHYKYKDITMNQIPFALHTPIVYRGIKVLLCYELQLYSKKSKYYWIICYKCIQGINVITALQNEF